MSQATPRQKCPNCGHVHDVSVYVTGQRILCQCKLHFVVQRQDVRPTPVAIAGCPAKEDVDKDRTGDIGDTTYQQKAISRFVSSRPPVRQQKNTEGAITTVCKPKELPGYQMVQLLGRGGMGEVWKARQCSLGRDVAIKFLSSALAKGNQEYVRRFEKEAAALAALSHPNIVNIIDRGCHQETQTWFFVMEFCEGRSLRELMMTRSASIFQNLRIISQVARAIDYAHERGVIHRDLKPENILVDDQFHAKVVDFGLAGFSDGNAFENLTGVSTAMGTLHYMSPEQRKDAHAVDERTDIFSLGVILYESLTGEIPVGRFKLPSQRLPGISTYLDKIVVRSLEVDPEARYSRAKNMAVEVEATLSSMKRNNSVLKTSPDGKKRRKFLWF